MKYITISILTFFCSALVAQIPDTIFVEQYTDSTYLIAIGTTNKANDRLNVQYIDQVFDSVGVANFAYDCISENENTQRRADLIKMKADLIKMKADALTNLYADVNSLLNRFMGSGYLANSFARHYTTYIGYYRAKLGQSVSLFQLKADGTAIEVNAQGQPVQAGFSGTWDVITNSRWRLKNFFPTNILADDSVLNRLDNPDTAFMAVGSAVVLTKIQQ